MFCGGLLIVKVNGKDCQVPDAHSICDLARARGFLPGTVAVALNGAVIASQEWHLTNLKPGDEVDLIRHVGGG